MIKEQLSALEKFHVIKAHLEEGVCMTEIAKIHRFHRDTILQWIDKYKKQGFSGLERKPRSDKSRLRHIHDELQKVVEALALRKPPMTISVLHHKVVEIANDQYLRLRRVEIGGPS